MSTRSRTIKLLLIIGISGALALTILTYMGFRNAESKERLSSVPWKVELLLINGENGKNYFKRLKFGLLKTGEIILPLQKGFTSKTPIQFSKWIYTRKGMIDGQIKIVDTEQGIFSGLYDIEILDYRTPQLIKLYSPTIEFYLREQHFSLENQLIEMDWNELIDEK